MCQSVFLAVWNELDKVKHTLHYAALKLVATLIP
jgi:hypothetical protein